MPKISHCTLLLLVFFLAACTNAKKEAMGLSEIASPVLLNELDALVKNRKSNDSLRIILINISDSTLHSCPSSYYDTTGSAGYSFYKGRLIGFYIQNGGDRWGFVDTAKLLKGIPSGYPIAYPDSLPEYEVLINKYDYTVRGFHILSKDSLKMIFWGYY